MNVMYSKRALSPIFVRDKLFRRRSIIDVFAGGERHTVFFTYPDPDYFELGEPLPKGGVGCTCGHKDCVHQFALATWT